jgi:hypothetical protein
MDKAILDALVSAGWQFAGRLAVIGLPPLAVYLQIATLTRHPVLDALRAVAVQRAPGDRGETMPRQPLQAIPRFGQGDGDRLMTMDL